MKKKILAVVMTLLVALLLAYMGYVWWQLDRFPGKIWLHRVNSVEKLHEKVGRYPNFEVDICLRPGGVMDVTHDADTTFHLTIVPYMEFLGTHPQSHMWMDVKNLTEENSPQLHRTLDSLVTRYGVDRGQLVVESPEWKLLFPITRDGYYTSCYVTAPRPSRLSREQRDSVISRLGIAARSGCVMALSFPAYWYNSLRMQLTDTDVDYLTWQNHRTQFGMLVDPLGQVMLRDKRVKVILVKDKGHYHR